MTELTLAAAARMIREATKDKSYRALPLGQEAGHYLRHKRKRLTSDSYRDYESCLHKLAVDHADLELEDFEPPIGIERLEEFLERRWGDGAPRTYNKNLSILRDFFRWQLLRGRLHGDPTLPIERARARGVYRTIFTADQRAAILAAQTDLRDRVALRLLLDWGIRKGALQHVQFRHFDHQRRRLTVFTKGEKVRELPLPSVPFWLDLERHILDWGARPKDYLLPRRKWVPHGPDPANATVVEYRVGRRGGPQPMGAHGLHDWWYRCLERASVVEPGQTSGERMHKARHTAGQRVLDVTGNLKAVQKLLGHETIATTADIYTDWDIEQLRDTLREVLEADDD